VYKNTKIIRVNDFFVYVLKISSFATTEILYGKCISSEHINAQNYPLTYRYPPTQAARAHLNRMISRHEVR